MPRRQDSRDERIAELKKKLARYETEVPARVDYRELLIDGLRLSMENEALKKEVAALRQQLATKLAGSCDGHPQAKPMLKRRQTQ